MEVEDNSFHFVDYFTYFILNNNSSQGYFNKIKTDDLLTKDNPLYNLIHSETKSFSEYFDDSIKKFHSLFNKNLKDFESCLEYLEKIAIPNKCVCAGVIDTIPGWRCVDCSKYENSIYCNDCYIKSKDLHKNHKVFFLFASSGMCDCGDPDSLSTFCPEHTGPHVKQKEIDDYISKSFEKEIIEKLKCFFDVFFSKLSKYLILTEKCDYFCKEFFEERFKDNASLSNEKKDVILLKSNFGVIFQNILNFLRLISQKNLGMLYLIANFFLKNNFENEKINEEYKTTHNCIKLADNNIEFLNTNEPHICICPFIRLFLSNFRDNIKSDKNQEFLLSFVHNYLLRSAFYKIYLFLYKQMMLNNNTEIIDNRTQFYLEDTSSFIAQRTNLIEGSYNCLYEYLSKHFKSKKIKNESGSINEELIRELFVYPIVINTDTKYYSKPKIRQFMTEKTSIVKRVIDCICLIHNINEFKSIVPHPQFQEKSFSFILIKIEYKLLNIIEGIIMYIDWEKIVHIKDIFNYIINKILNQEKEEIKQLKEEEYSFHLPLYRCFGLLMNSFCFNYAFRYNCTLVDAIEYFKTTFFENQNQIELLVDILLKDYFKIIWIYCWCKK